MESRFPKIPLIIVLASLVLILIMEISVPTKTSDFTEIEITDVDLEVFNAVFLNGTNTHKRPKPKTIFIEISDSLRIHPPMPSFGNSKYLPIIRVKYTPQTPESQEQKREKLRMMELIEASG